MKKFIQLLRRLALGNWHYSADGTTRIHKKTGLVQKYEYDDWGSYWVDF